MKQKKVNYNGQKVTTYEASQIQRKIERNIRRWKRENEAAKVIGIGTEESAAKLKYWRLEMDDFISQTGFKRQYAREDIFAKNIKKNVKYLETIDFKDAKIVQSTIEKYETQIVQQKFESAIVVLPSGKVYKVDGDSMTVDPRDVGNLKGAVVTHNHPEDVTEFSFSEEEDFALFEETGIKQLHGIDYKYVYILERGSEKETEIPSNNIDYMTMEGYRHYFIAKLAKERGFFYERKRRE